MTNGAESPPGRLLVGLDGSRLAETVLPTVRVLAKALGAQVILLHVLEREAPATIHGEPHLTTAAGAEHYLEQVATRLRGVGLAVTTHVHPNAEQNVAASIAAHAAEMNADLIALCAHGAGGIREWLVGRIPQLVAARARRPVLIVPASTTGDVATLRRVMMPIDQAGEAVKALPLAKRLAIACTAELMLVTVVPTPTTMPGDAGAATVFLPRTAATLLNWAEDAARQQLDELAQTLREAGLSVATEVRRGDRARVLLQAIAAQKVDLVVMATHARVGLEGFLAGSVAPRVAGAAPCPVLLVPIQD